MSNSPLYKGNGCRECKERHPGCHSDCEKYLAWKQQLSEKKGKILDEYKKRKIVEDFVVMNDTKRKKIGGFIK